MGCDPWVVLGSSNFAALGSSNFSILLAEKKNKP